MGGAHDEAMGCRASLKTESDRIEYLVAAREGRVEAEALKLALALTFQRAARSGLPRAFGDAYDRLVAGEFELERDGGLGAIARCAAPGVDRYNLNVQLDVKPDRRGEFLEVIAANAAGTLREPRNLR